jgi:DNA-binding SARP family transcriptional activator
VAIETRAEADLVLGRHGELAGELEALWREHPLRERLWELLILSLYRAGRQAEALRGQAAARTGSRS